MNQEKPQETKTFKISNQTKEKTEAVKLFIESKNRNLFCINIILREIF